jgi:hypothetical protein
MPRDTFTRPLDERTWEQTEPGIVESEAGRYWRESASALEQRYEQH